jgi:hypothetical protein
LTICATIPNRLHPERVSIGNTLPRRRHRRGCSRERNGRGATEVGRELEILSPIYGGGEAMPVDIAATIRSLGQSDMTIIGVDPRTSDLSEWRAARIKRGCSITKQLTRESKVKARPVLVAPPKPKGWTPDSRRVTSALIGATKRAQYEMWANEQEARNGWVTAERADQILHRRKETTRRAMRAGQIAPLLVHCPPLGRTVRMMRLADVLSLGVKP